MVFNFPLIALAEKYCLQKINESGTPEGKNLTLFISESSGLGRNSFIGFIALHANYSYPIIYRT